MSLFRMFRSIQIKLILMVLLLILIAVQLIGVYFISTMKNSLIDSFTKNLDSQATLLTTYLSDPSLSAANTAKDGTDDAVSKNEMLSSLVGNFFTISGAEVQILDSSGKVLATSKKTQPSVVGRKNTSLLVSRAQQGVRDNEEEIIDEDNTRNKVIAKPVISNNKIVGAVYIVASMKEVYETMEGINRIFVSGTLIALGLTAVLGVLLAGTITSPIKALTRQATAVAEGRFDQRVPVFGKDEIGQLSSAFNDMTDRLSEALTINEEEKEKLASILSNMSDGVLATDELGKVIVTNRRARGMLGIVDMKDGTTLSSALGIEKMPIAETLQGKQSSLLLRRDSETEDELGVPSEGRIRFAERAEDGEYVYGFRNYDGVIVIPAIYAQAEDYREGRAVVQTVDGRYSLLDRDGQSVAVFPEDARYVNGYAEGIAVYQSSSSSQYGYLDEAGDLLIEAQYQYAEPFKNGLAIVTMSDESLSGTLSGVIDRVGNVVIPFAYSSLYRLGNGWYALGATREGELQPTYRVADEKGTLLGSAVYESVWDAGERVVVYDGTRSFFLDCDGRQDPSLPSVEGQPLLSLSGDFVQVIGQGRTQILSTSGEEVWAETRSIELPGGIAIIEHVERDGQSRAVYYPQLSGIGDAAQEAKLNTAFREDAVSLLEPYRNPDASASPEDLDWLADTTLSYDYELAGRIGRVLIIKQTGYEYNSGAAHGMPWQSYAHVDQDSGLTYRLADLLTPDGMLEVERRIRTDAGDDPEATGYDLSDWEGLTGEDLFAIEEGALVVYFSPYEIAPYAAGFPEFRYPLSELGGWIDQEGEFWRALERE